MIKKFTLILLSLTLGMLWVSTPSFSQTTTSTTVESVTTKTPVAPVKRAPVRRSTSARPVEQTTAVTSTTTTTVPPPPKEVVHKVYDEEALKKMSKNLCSAGFKAYVGTDKKNVCLNQATPPDLAYSCVWDKNGVSAFEASDKGPCNLDYTTHHGSVTIKKDLYKNNPPLDYGKEVQCCFRPAKSYETATK